MNLLDTYVAGWREAADAVLAVTADLTPEQWATPTDCPGWDVRDVVAHCAHLEAVLAELEPDLVVEADGGAGLVSSYTEAGVEARRDRSTDDLRGILEAAVAQRAAQLAELPTDPDARATLTPGGVDWSWDVLLRNRAIDLWVHEQDLRRALGTPGGLGGVGAQIATMTFSMAMPYVLGKRVKAEPGTTVRWEVTGDVPADLVVRVGDDGHASTVELVDADATTLTMSTETFTMLGAGRRAPDDLPVTITGDEDLGRRVLAHMAVTP